LEFLPVERYFGNCGDWAIVRHVPEVLVLLLTSQILASLGPVQLIPENKQHLKANMTSKPAAYPVNTRE
jgi:hypothetical protein